MGGADDDTGLRMKGAGQIGNRPGQPRPQLVQFPPRLAVGKQPIGCGQQPPAADRVAEKGLRVGPRHREQSKKQRPPDRCRTRPAQPPPRPKKQRPRPGSQQRVEQQRSMNQPDLGPDTGRPDQRRGQQNHPQPLAGVQVAVRPDVALLVPHPQQLVVVQRAPTHPIFCGGKGRKPIAAVDPARIGEHRAGQQKAKDQKGCAAVFGKKVASVPLHPVTVYPQTIRSNRHRQPSAAVQLRRTDRPSACSDLRPARPAGAAHRGHAPAVPQSRYQ